MNCLSSTEPFLAAVYFESHFWFIANSLLFDYELFSGVSETTVHRRLNSLDLRRDSPLVTDEELDAHISGIKRNLPDTVGIGIIEGHLKSNGIVLPNARKRIWESLVRIDPIRTALRWNTPIGRRSYWVPGRQFRMFYQ
jgi:hypothetical protein